jgi:type I restriction enzyme S subunit
MVSEWPRVQISDVCEFIVDCVNKTAPIVDGPTPYKMVRTTNIRNGRVDLSQCRYVNKETFEKWTRRQSVQSGDVLLTREAPIGEVGFVDTTESIFLGQRVMQYRANPELLDSRFLLYSFLSQDLQHQFGAHEGSGSVVSHIRVGDCYKFKISLPPLDEQRRIAHILGTLDDKIELNRQLNATLEQLARSLFQSWFVDFDPVRAKASGEPEESICRRLSLTPELLALFPSALEESAMGEIPVRWKVKSTNELASINNWTLSKRDALSHINYVEISEVNRGSVGSITRYEPGLEPSRAKRRVKHGDTVISTVRPDRGAYFLCLEPAPELIVSTGFAVVSPKSAPWSFIYSALTSDSMLEHLGLIADGAAYPTVNPSVIGNREFAWPSNEAIVDAYHDYAEPLYLQSESCRVESRSLAALRDELLPKLLSGEVRLTQQSAKQQEAEQQMRIEWTATATARSKEACRLDSMVEIDTL